MLRLLFLAVAVYGAAIPPNPTCLEKCLTTGGVVGAASDLNYFKSVAVDINNFCNVYTALLKCAAECSQNDLNLLMNHTVHASYVCKDKMDQIKRVHDCLEKDTTDPLTDCAKMCQLTEHGPLRLDSTPTAPVNPNVPAEGTGPLCTKQMCVLKCAHEQLNKQCTGAGDLFKDMARHQISVGWETLQMQSENMNDTASQLVALSYLANIPESCVFLTNLEVFDEQMKTGSDKKTMAVPTDFSNDTMTESAEPSEGFDPLLFEFEPILEPDVPRGPPSVTEETTKEEEEEEEETSVDQDEEPVKIIGQETPAIGPIATSIDAAGSTEMKGEEGVHEQPKPAEMPSETASSEEEKTAETEESSDKEAAVGPRPSETAITGEGTGLIPSHPVTEEDKDKEEVEESEKVEAGAGGVTASTEEKTEGTTSGEGMAASKEEKTSEETTMEGAEKTSEEKEEEGTTEESTGEMTTESVIVVDDQADTNTVTSTPEEHKGGNSSTSALFSSFFIALIAFFLL